ncbi:MAG TPA: CehA/McbA family metallohydrolase [Polyangiaceae bacterium]|nr:CehA/McbA family metallohydrolase [Polyangiaceae bacterium]
MRRRPVPLLALAALLTLAPISRRAHADSTMTLEGDVPAGGPEHFFVPFDVPAGTKELEIVHDSLTPANILDFGLDDAQGYRGWGGGTDEHVVVNERAASRAYVPGPLDRGGFRVVVGKAKLVASPAKYRIQLLFRDAPTLAPQPERKAYSPGPALATGARYYAGDFHVHSRESTDAKPTLDEIAVFARSRGLDFVEISDHNTVTQQDLFADAQARHPSLLFVPGIEFTTYAGHANAVGGTRFVDHRLGQPGVTIGGAVDAILAQGAVFSINHPLLDLGDVCIGCAWKHDVAPDKVGGYELGTGGQKEGARLFLDVTLAAWEVLLDRGSHAAAMGGGDDHAAGKATGAFASPLGSPTTLVYATELSAPAIVDAVKRGRTVVKLQGPEDPMVELTTEGGGLPGDRLRARSVRVRATVTGGRGHHVRFVRDGAVDTDAEITSDPFTLEATVSEATLSAAASAGRELRVRAEVVVDDKPRTITSHVFVTYDPAGPAAAERDAAAAPSSGCGVAPAGGGVSLAVASCAAALVAYRRRRRGAS